VTGDIGLFLLSGTDGGVPKVSIDATLRTGDNFSCVSQSNLEEKNNIQIIIIYIYIYTHTHTYTGSTYKPLHKIRIQTVSDLHKGFVPETFTLCKLDFTTLPLIYHTSSVTYTFLQCQFTALFIIPLTNFTKLVHLNGRKAFNLRLTYRNRNNPSTFVRVAGA